MGGEKGEILTMTGCDRVGEKKVSYWEEARERGKRRQRPLGGIQEEWGGRETQKKTIVTGKRA